MKKLLYIDSCVLRETSNTRKIADALVANLQQTGEYVTEQLVLEKLDLRPFTSETLAHRNQLRHAENYDDALCPVYGIDQAECISVNGTDIPTPNVAQAVAGAIASIPERIGR